MGTNFFWVPPAIAAAHPPVPGDIPPPALHIGKRSAAGYGACSFGMQAIADGPDGPINTWQRWRNIILLAGGRVIDEYGDPRDPADFVVEFEETTIENRRRQYDWARLRGAPFAQAATEGVIPPVGDRRDYLCPDGFSFCYPEFS